MAEFTTRDFRGGRTLGTWTALLNFGEVNAKYPELVNGVIVSLALAVVSVALMLLLLLPTMTWVRLRLPRLNSTVETLCLLPLSIPAIVLVVGLVPVYAWVTYFLGSPRSGCALPTSCWCCPSPTGLWPPV